MASWTITIPDAQVAEVVIAICEARGYQMKVPHPTDPDAPWIDNPETPSQFARRQPLEDIKRLVVARRRRLKAAEADATTGL